MVNGLVIGMQLSNASCSLIWGNQTVPFANW